MLRFGDPGAGRDAAHSFSLGQAPIIIVRAVTDHNLTRGSDQEVSTLTGRGGAGRVGSGGSYESGRAGLVGVTPPATRSVFLLINS